MRIALDLDGVLVNFTKAACKVMGEPYPQGRTFTRYSWLFDKYGKPSCYKRMRGHHFWEEMEKYPWADELVNLVDQASEGDWVFLTKPMRDPFCFSGKHAWVAKHFPAHAGKLIITAAPKHNFARNRLDVLIDDKIENIDEWDEAGGSGFFWLEASDDIGNEVIQPRLAGLSDFLDNLQTPKFINPTLTEPKQ